MIKKIYFILLSAVFIFGCFQNTKNNSMPLEKEGYTVDTWFDWSGKNLACPTTLWGAKRVQNMLNTKIEQGEVLNNNLITNLFENRFPLLEGKTFQNTCKVLKLDSTYFEILFFPYKKNKEDRETYFIATPDSIYHLNFEKILNENEIFRRSD